MSIDTTATLTSRRRPDAARARASRLRLLASAGPGLDALTRERIDARLEEFLDARAAELLAVSPQLAPVAEVVHRSIRGGKRLRAAFCWQGWRGAGGEGDDTAAVGLAAALELFHVAALVHDDVMDRSPTRRGVPTVHRAMAQHHRDSGLVGDATRHGDEVAVLVGDLCLTWSDQLLTTSVAGSPHRQAVHQAFDLMRTQVIAGQYLDLLEAARPGGSSDVDDVRAVLHYKSAKYTVEHPLVLGGALAGASADLRAAYAAFGLPVGEGFQLRDDLLGVFGDPARTGKPADDDLREGKHTLLVSYAAERATGRQREVLDRHLGAPDLDADGAEALRSVLVATGARSRAESRISELHATARGRLAQLGALGVPEDVRTSLGALADAAVRRES
jgi:geranylgeranyl diphosphate synthase type I